MARIFDRLSDQILADKTGLKYWGQKICERLEAEIARQDQAIADIAAAQAAANAAQTTADTAQTTADTASTTANTVKTTDKISGSATAPTNCLSATDAGSNATITIAANTRLYGDNTSLDVSGGTLTGKAYSTTYAVYYDDATCSDTTPTYVATTTLKTAMHNYVSGRHFVGQITTPASGGGGTSGGGTPPGGGGPYP